MKAIYAGSFNLFHAGHYYVYQQACKMFGKKNVWLCIAINPKKNIAPHFIKWTLNPITPNVIVADGLVVNESPDILIRGLRDTMDLAEELTMSDWNRELGANTVFVPCTGELRHISSSILRDLYSRGVDINKTKKNISQETYLSFRRWKEGKLPDRKLYCGKISIGKSTYLNDLEMETVDNHHLQYVGDCDKLIWKFFSETDKAFIKKQFMDCINCDDKKLGAIGYQAILREMSKSIDWHDLFNDDYINYEASALGQWMGFIPYDILTKFEIVELECDMFERVKRCKGRDLNREAITKFDNFYKRPYFVDQLIDIS